MKRKASNALGAEGSSKISKGQVDDESDSHVINSSQSTETAKESALTSPRLSSARQRKAPAWLSSYVTDGSTTIKESPKSKVPTSASPVKKKISKSSPQPVTEDNKGQSKTEDEPPSLRRGSTLKVEDSPPHPTKNKKLQNAVVHSSSLVRKDTEILSSPASDSGDSASESKPDTTLAGMKVPNRLNKSSVSLSSQTSNSSSSHSQALSEITHKMPSKRHITSQSSILAYGVDAEEFSSSDVMEVCDTKNLAEADEVNVTAVNISAEGGVSIERQAGAVLEKPKMLEIVICISTSGAMRDYLTVLQEKTKDLVWQLQSLIPDLRIGVLAHTQGGIHDDKPGSGTSAIDHNYIRTGGHSGTKWLDLGATFSQICAFVDSLEPEATVYPDYVQDNLEMALWKLQRCMSWSSCSYRTVVMIGRGRPNRTSFYLQREHWRGWIRSALEIGHKAEIPVIDWELEAKLLAQMGIHVFTIQASSPKTLVDEEEDEGSTFFRRVAEITNGLHIKLTEASKLIDIIVGVCCACHGPDLLQNHRDTLRDENDGVLPPQLKDIFVLLQLHSKRRSLSTIPSLVGDLSILKNQLANADANGNISSSEEEEASGDEGVQAVETKGTGISEGSKALKNRPSVVQKASKKSNSLKAGKKSPGNTQKVAKKNKSLPVKSGSKATKVKSQSITSGNAARKSVKALKNAKIEQKGAKNVAIRKTKENKTVLVREKNVSHLNVKKQGLKGKRDKQVKVTVKPVQAKNKNVKAVTKAVAQKNTKIRPKSVTVSAASLKKGKKIKVLNSDQSSKSKNVAECKLPQASGP